MRSNGRKPFLVIDCFRLKSSLVPKSFGSLLLHRFFRESFLRSEDEIRRVLKPVVIRVKKQLAYIDILLLIFTHRLFPPELYPVAGADGLPTNLPSAPYLDSEMAGDPLTNLVAGYPNLASELWASLTGTLRRIRKLRLQQFAQVSRQLVHIEVAIFPRSVCCLERLVIRLSIVANALRHNPVPRQNPAKLQADQVVARRPRRPSVAFDKGMIPFIRHSAYAGRIIGFSMTVQFSWITERKRSISSGTFSK